MWQGEDSNEQNRLIYSWKYSTSTKPRPGKKKGATPKIQLWKTAGQAARLHQDMYRTVVGNNGTYDFQKGRDISTIKDICTEGLRDDLVKQIRYRSAGESARWEIRGVWPHITARVVSNRAMQLPRPDSALRQAVVRIRSRQRVLRTDRAAEKATLVNKAEGWMNMVEYLVLQKRILDGVEGDWKIWGTTEESSFEKVLGIETLRVPKSTSVAT